MEKSVHKSKLFEMGPDGYGYVDGDVPDSLVCSTLCSRALLRAEISVLRENKALTTPAWLSEAPQLEDVDVQWRRVLPASHYGELQRIVRAPEHHYGE